MAYHVDSPPSNNPHINYEPSVIGGLKEADKTGKEHTPHVSGELKGEAIDRPNNFGQAGETFRRLAEWEKEELISNLSGALADVHSAVREQMIKNVTEADADYGKRLSEAIKKERDSMEEKSSEAVEEANERSQPSDPY